MQISYLEDSRSKYAEQIKQVQSRLVVSMSALAQSKAEVLSKSKYIDELDEQVHTPRARALISRRFFHQFTTPVRLVSSRTPQL